MNALYWAMPRQCMATGRRFSSEQAFQRHQEVLRFRQRKLDEGAKGQQGWLPAVDQWITGLSADVGGGGANFFDGRAQAAPGASERERERAAEEREVSVPADDSQTACALSGAQRSPLSPFRLPSPPRNPSLLGSAGQSAEPRAANAQLPRCPQGSRLRRSGTRLRRSGTSGEPCAWSAPSGASRRARWC